MKWTGTKHCEEGSNAIIQPAHPRLFRAVRAAEKLSIRLRAVSDHLAAAVRARRRQRVDGAFKAVEPVRLAGDGDLNRLVVIVPASFACIHDALVVRS